MKLLLVADPVEEPQFTAFLEDMVELHSQNQCHDSIEGRQRLVIIVLGNILDFFPLNPHDEQQLRRSVLYNIFPQAVIQGSQHLLEKKGKNLNESPFVGALEEVLLPNGKHVEEALDLVFDRYQSTVSEWDKIMGDKGQILIVPGDNDFSGMLDAALHSLPNVKRVTQLDHGCSILMVDGVKIGGLGGCIMTSSLFSGVLERPTPNVMHHDEYARRLNLLWGVDILIISMRPEECDALETFIKKSPVSLVICPAKYDLSQLAMNDSSNSSNNSNSGRGGRSIHRQSELTDINGKCCIYVRSFEMPINLNYLINVKPGMLSSLNLPLEVVKWNYNEHHCHHHHRLENNKSNNPEQELPLANLYHSNSLPSLSTLDHTLPTKEKNELHSSTPGTSSLTFSSSSSLSSLSSSTNGTNSLSSPTNERNKPLFVDRKKGGIKETNVKRISRLVSRAKKKEKKKN